MTWSLVAATAVAFLLGGANPAVGLARLLGKDIRATGSGNPGATNVGRTFGAGWGVLIGLLDVGKGWLPAWLAQTHGSDLGWAAWAGYLLGLAAVVGHVYSPYLGGRGGKGVATTFGAVLGIHPLYAAVLVVVFLAAALSARHVALGSIAGSIVMVAAGLAGSWLPGSRGLPTTVWLVGLGGLVLLRHQRNLRAWWARVGPRPQD